MNQRGSLWQNNYGSKDRFIGYDILTREFRNICRTYDPDRVYIPSTPFGGRFPNDPEEGSNHGYTNIYFVPGWEHVVFAGEDTRACAPMLKSLKRFFRPEDLWPDGYSSACTYGTKWPWPDSWMKYTGTQSWKKTGPVHELHDAHDAESLVYRLGMGNSMYYKDTIERNRRGRRVREADIDSVERVCNGYIMVKPNDSWPQVYSGKIDYFLEPYMPYYAVKRAFSPVLVSIEVSSNIYAWVINDTPDVVNGLLTIVLFDPGRNAIIKSTQRTVKVAPGESRIVVRLDEFKEFPREYLLFAELRDNMGQYITRNNAFVDIERRLEFPEATLSLSLAGDILEVRTDEFARCVYLSGDEGGDEFGWYFDDNYFDLFPFEVRRVRVKGPHTSGSITAKPYFLTTRDSNTVLAVHGRRLKQMKTFYNNAEDYVDEMLVGILAAHPGQLRQAEGEIRAILRADAPIAGKVAVVSGGGSGHLPVFMGYVGRGLLDGASVGNVFASPSMDQMLTLTRAVHGGRGVLYLYGNYGGDIMNFDLASELSAEEGIEVSTIIVSDDIASAPKGSESDRRGVAGLFYAYKVAGACADSGASLKEVVAITKKALQGVRSIGVAIAPCEVPGAGKPSFTLQNDQMGIGMGIHGEAGIYEGPRTSADEVAADMVRRLLDDMPLPAGESVSVLINSLGATPLEELYIVYRKVAEILLTNGISVYHPFVGRYATSMEMAGFSITLCKLNDQLRTYLDHPVQTPFIREGD